MVLNIQFQETNNVLNLNLNENNENINLNFGQTTVIVHEKVKDVIVKDGQQQHSVVNEDHEAIIDLTDYAKDTDVENEASARIAADSALNNNKVDKVQGKGLSTNDYDNTEKNNVAANTSARHSHENKALLDTYNQTNSNIEDAIIKKHIHDANNLLNADYIQNGNTNKVFTATDKENLDSNTAARHSHSNKALLDSYTQTESNLADAVSKKHSHSNKTLLDSYTQTEANLADAVSKKHSHSNKTILDNLTQDVIDNSHSHSNKALLDTYDQTNANITDAVSKKHSHSNKTILDNLTQGVIDNSHSHTNKSVLDGIASTNLVSSGDRTNWNGKTSINDSSTSSTTETWSANKLQSVLGDIEATLQSIRGVS